MNNQQQEETEVPAATVRGTSTQINSDEVPPQPMHDEGESTVTEEEELAMAIEGHADEGSNDDSDEEEGEITLASVKNEVRPNLLAHNTNLQI